MFKWLGLLFEEIFLGGFPIDVAWERYKRRQNDLPLNYPIFEKTHQVPLTRNEWNKLREVYGIPKK